ncbi:MAG: hypothetical protein ED859_10035 [Desulfuromonadales bacterium]|nr:MAG: hypothetical protein ED859_10035 [Desulfuromonadales bacterium]
MTSKGQGLSRMKAFMAAATVVFALLVVVAGPAAASDTLEAEGIVDKARITLINFMDDSNYSWFHNQLKNARGVLIFPQMLKGGFFLGGSGGTGVLLVKDEKTGEWSYPAFYTMGSISFGLQFGGEAAEVVMLVMTKKGVDSLYSSSVKLGGDTSISIGPVGAGAKGEVITDIISFAKSKGLYAGLNLEGSILTVRDGLNEGYYGKDVRPVEIIVFKKASNKKADELRSSLAKAAR